MFNNTLFNPCTRTFETLPEVPPELANTYQMARLRFNDLVASLNYMSSKPLDKIDFKACAQIAAREIAQSDGDEFTKLVDLLKRLFPS